MLIDEQVDNTVVEALLRQLKNLLMTKQLLVL